MIEHYRSPPAGSGQLEITPLEINDEEGRELAAFLASLDGGVNLADRWLRAPADTATR